jgi:Tol biopolymer transport system component
LLTITVYSLLSAAAFAGPLAQASTILIADETSFDGINHPSISGDGRWIAFECETLSVCLYDRQSGIAEVIIGDAQESGSRASTPSISTDGRYIVYQGGGTGGETQVRVYDREAGTSEVASLPAPGAIGDDNLDASEDPGISADGRYVVFATGSDDFVPGDINGSVDVFLRDRVAGTTELVSVSSEEVQGDGHSGTFGGPTVSADGRYVAFQSDAENLVANDLNGYGDVFVRDRTSGTTTRVSVSSGGLEADDTSDWSIISDDGSSVVFATSADTLTGIFLPPPYIDHLYVHDLAGATTRRITNTPSGAEPDSDSTLNDPPSVSADGRHVAFDSRATDIVPGAPGALTKVFTVDRQTGTSSHISLDVDGQPFADDAEGPTISDDGRFVAFTVGNALYLRDRGDFMSPAMTCGDPIPDTSQTGSDTKVTTASDALFLLQAAVGLQTCELCVCDVNDSGNVTASDALAALGFAVGQAIELSCPACS